MNEDVDFCSVLRLTKETLMCELLKYSDVIYNKEIIIDNRECFRINIEWERCIGELIVEKQEFAPYRYVSFNILSSITDKLLSIFWWHDTANDSLEIVKEKIIEGVRIASEY